jgi:hypothetical protein
VLISSLSSVNLVVGGGGVAHRFEVGLLSDIRIQ